MEEAGRWLLIFDSADDIDVWTYTPRNRINALRNKLPVSKLGSILFTTRVHRNALDLASLEILNLSELDGDDSEQMLRNCLLEPEICNDQKATAFLLQKLTNLPLAIAQAAAFINKEKLPSLAGYISLLTQEEAHVIKLLSEDFGDEYSSRGVKHPVATTWNISFKQIMKNDVLAAQFLFVMACVNPRNIPMSLLPSCPTAMDNEKALGTLKGYCFIIEESNTGTESFLTVHRLVHLATRNWLRRKDLFSFYAEISVLKLHDLMHCSSTGPLFPQSILMPHVACILESGTDTGQGRHADLSRLHEMYLELKKSCFSILKVSLKILEIHESPNGTDSSPALSSCIEMLSSIGQGENAEMIRVRMEEHKDSMIGMKRRADDLIQKSQYEDAEFILRRAVDGKDTLKTTDTDALSCMVSLAETLRHQNRLDEAKDLLIGMIRDPLRAINTSYLEVKDRVNDLARAFTKKLRHKDSRELYEQLFHSSKAIHGPNHKDTLNIMFVLGCAWYEEGFLDKQITVWSEYVDRRRAVFGPHDPETIKHMELLEKVKASRDTAESLRTGK